jgi:calcium-translocating P-type ATPase
LEGLSDAEAAQRLREVRALPVPKPTGAGYLAIAVQQFLDPLAGLLVLAAAISAVIGERLDAGAIAAIVAINATLGFAQEASAERAVRALRESVQPIAIVRRSGRERRVPSSEVVHGDVVLLREGDRVVTDGRLAESFGLEVDESMLTGESVPVAKLAGDSDEGRVYAGTAVTRGRAVVVADAVGEATELSRIAMLTDTATSPPTPLERRLAVLSRQMVAFGVAITILLAAGMLLRGGSPREAFLVGVSVAVAAVPEGLATTVAIALALAARSMARRHAIVRRLDAAETLGEVSVICTDKTGTLTENRLRVAAVSARGAFRDADVLTVGLLASSPLSAQVLDEPQAAGDPIEIAIARAVRDSGLDCEEITDRLDFLAEIPFDAERRSMTRIWGDGERRFSHVKGAPEPVFAASALTDSQRISAERQAATWAASGLRVLAVGRRELGADEDTEPAALEHELDRSDLDLVGVIAFEDPLRPASLEAMHAAHAAGIGVRMLTGDHLATARAIAAKLDIPEDHVHARITPEEKLRVVEQLQADGHVVAVTGDGVNDAPALRRADVGIAMGRSGTEAAREAADVVLTDDDFSTIVAAVREGRVIADNVRKVTAFLLSANLGEVVMFAIAIAFGLGAPMTVIQVLLVNLLTDGLPAIALARDPASAETMRPRARGDARLLPRTVWMALVAVGVTVGLVGLVAYLIGRTTSPVEARTMAFATVALAELALAFSLRSTRLPPWHQPVNALLVHACVISAAVVAVIVYLPATHQVLGTAALSSPHAALVAALALVPVAVAESAKYLRNRGVVR